MIRRNAGVTGAEIEMLHGHGTITGKKDVYGYKVHVVIDSDSGLPVMLTITKAGYVENRTVSWFGIAESTSHQNQEIPSRCWI